MTHGPSRARRVTALGAGAALLVASALASRPASAAPGDRSAHYGLEAAKKGDCISAVPLLENAELARHRPTTAVALARCYVVLGELIKASDLYHAVASEPVARGFTRADREAMDDAKKAAAEVDKRIPTVRFEPAEPYEGLTIEVNGHPVEDVTAPKRLPPDVRATVTARATGRREHTESFVPTEGERRTMRIELASLAPKPVAPKRTPYLVGVRFQGFVIPKLFWHMFGSGGRSVFVPGGGVTLTVPKHGADVVLFLGYAHYGVGDTPFKPNGAPDTDYEIVDANLSALYATASLLWSKPLDAQSHWTFHYGAGVGLGWMFAGDIHRTQAYPPKGATSVYQWQKCRGPNNPAGSFLYCNELDSDRDHYNGYAEPDWFHGGARPALYPLVTLPELVLSYHPSPALAVDLGAGLGLSGILLHLGGRWSYPM